MARNCQKEEKIQGFWKKREPCAQVDRLSHLLQLRQTTLLQMAHPEAPQAPTVFCKEHPVTRKHQFNNPHHFSSSFTRSASITYVQKRKKPFNP